MSQQAVVPKLLPGEHADVRDDARELIQDADLWFDTPNTVFYGKSAKELLEEGREDFVRLVLRSIRYGMFT
ncbi:MAG TPA: hypothetical protein VHQ47_16255 [Phycisphaerae bacterium]|nr:hypothetical protein [Phycisphaerae bacterium]HVX86355.1 hypothetical protein [Phycisphaerae bacterium]